MFCFSLQDFLIQALLRNISCPWRKMYGAFYFLYIRCAFPLYYGWPRYVALPSPYSWMGGRQCFLSWPQYFFFMKGIPCLYGIFCSTFSRLFSFCFLPQHRNYFLCPRLDAFLVLSSTTAGCSSVSFCSTATAFAQTRLFSNAAVMLVCTNTRGWQDQIDWADIGIWIEFCNKEEAF